MANDGFDVYFGNGNDEGKNQYDFDSEIAHHLKIVSNLRKLKSMREIVIRKIEEDRGALFDELDPLIRDWEGPYPDLRKMFRPKEMDWLLTEYAKSVEMNERMETNVLNFVIRSGYKDEPELAEDGKPLLRRTTAVHYAGRRNFCYSDHVIHELFKIYDRFDANYSDDDGVTHFHIACKFGLAVRNVVEKFLELGQDPNCLPRGSLYPSLHLALCDADEYIVQLLLESGADPNLANADGQTPLHILCRYSYTIMAEIYFEICDDIHQTLLVNARNKDGDTPLHLALNSGNKEAVELLLRRGADPNSANDQGLTPLHNICQDYHVLHDDYRVLAELFFSVIDDIQKTVQVNAQDKMGRTPLQLAVVNHLLNVVDLLLDRGADLSSFIFPTDSQFDETITLLSRWDIGLVVASGSLGVVESLEKRGYELERNDALKIMNVFTKLSLFEDLLVDSQKCCYDDEEFVGKAKELMINPRLSLYDLVRLRPEQAKKLVTYKEYFNYAQVSHVQKFSKKKCSTLHLCEKLSRRFFRYWALDPFLELMHYQLPILCCEIIIKKLQNEDLCNICMAAQIKCQTIEINNKM